MVSQHTLSVHHYGKRASSCLRQGCRRNGIPRDATSQNNYSGDRNIPIDACDSCSQGCFYCFLESVSLHKISDRNSYQKKKKSSREPLKKSLSEERGAADPRRVGRSHNEHGSLLPPRPVPMGLSLLHLLSKQRDEVP